MTTEDYYRFINSPTYFSRKIFTLMTENTTVLLGYEHVRTKLAQVPDALKVISDS